MSDIIHDSSIWVDSDVYRDYNKEDNCIRMGVVRDIFANTENNTILYMVEVVNNADRYTMSCMKCESINGVFNFEETTLQKYNPSPNLDKVQSYSTKVGDQVIVANLNGSRRRGIILGSIKHEGRQIEITDVKNNAQYYRIFNGIETKINEDGELKVTFKGLPKNINILNEAASKSQIPKPIWDTATGGTYYQFKKDGSFILSDNSTTKEQYIQIDKTIGKINILSGDCIISLNKNDTSLTIENTTTKLTASDKITLKTSSYELEASASMIIRSPKIAIGGGGVEILDRIIKMIDTLKMMKIISPIGKCMPMGLSETWPEMEKIRSDINSIRGSL